MTEPKADSKFMLRTGVLVLIGLCLFLLGSLAGPGWAQGGDKILYNDFETGVKNKLYKSAYIDGNIITLQTNDGNKAYTQAPIPIRAVDLLIKSGVPVTARAVPASGITWPVVFILLVPYGVLAFYAFALASAAKSASLPLEPSNEDAKDFNKAESSLGEEDSES